MFYQVLLIVKGHNGLQSRKWKCDFVQEESSASSITDEQLQIVLCCVVRRVVSHGSTMY